jgi:hypothetical protein
MFKSKNAENDFAYIQYEENGGLGLQANGSEKGVLTIGIENDPLTTTIDDVISLFPAGGQGFVGINTKDPLYTLDVSGSVSMKSLNTVPIVLAGVGPHTLTFPLNNTYIFTNATAAAIAVTLPTLAGAQTSGLITFRKTGSIAAGSQINLTTTAPSAIVSATTVAATPVTLTVCSTAVTSAQFIVYNGDYWFV